MQEWHKKLLKIQNTTEDDSQTNSLQMACAPLLVGENRKGCTSLLLLHHSNWGRQVDLLCFLEPYPEIIV